MKIILFLQALANSCIFSKDWNLKTLFFKKIHFETEIISEIRQLFSNFFFSKEGKGLIVFFFSY